MMILVVVLMHRFVMHRVVMHRFVMMDRSFVMLGRMMRITMILRHRHAGHSD